MKSKFLLALFCAFGAGACAAADAGSEQGPYLGLFGGIGSASSSSLRQQGGFYLPGPLGRRVAVDADGRAGSKDVALGGIQAGYEWSRLNLGQTQWGLKPAVELEGIYIGKHSLSGGLPIDPHVLGTQYVTLPMRASVLLANAVFTFQTPYSNKVFPYLGAGVGVARMSIKGADSANPNEPGINHFDSNPDASDSAFAMQFKAGLKGELTTNLFLFAEYRYLSISSTRYTFGETLPPHLPTDPWDVSLGRQKYNLFSVGLQYKF
ncbi:MAG: outer membrane beta-barrel protein [Pigmentiphaga sp.]|nr:outer membrane beta-barrel protein [Pigmentiphaga sp.]